MDPRQSLFRPTRRDLHARIQAKHNAKSTWTSVWGRRRSMRATRFSETEIIYAIKQLEIGISIKEIARKY